MDNVKTTAYMPGPWFVDQDPRPGMQWNREIVADADHTICFMTHSDGHNLKRDKANARLVAAAPELLEALQALLEEAEQGIATSPFTRIAARHAIAKATEAA